MRLGLKEVGQMTEINLLPWRELKREQEKKQFTTLIAGVLVAAVGVVVLANYYMNTLIDNQTQRNHRIKQEINRFDRQISEIKKLKEVKQALISRMNIVQNLQATRPLTVHLFDELVEVMPSAIYVTKIERKDNYVTIYGYSESNSNISLLMRKIEKDKWIQSPVLTEIKKRKNQKIREKNEFVLSFYLKSL
jgi:type IV pilus assembly protein PilN